MREPTERGVPIERWPLDCEPGPARPLSEAQREALVEAVLERHAAAQQRPPRRAWTWWQVAAALALAAVGATGASAAVMWWGRKAPPSEAPAATVEQTRPERPREAQPPVEPPPAQEAAPEPTAPEIGPRKPERRSPEPRAAQDLLERANELRGQREFRAAARTYARAIAAEPGSHVAYVARVAQAGLELEHLGRPARALERYRQALRQNPQGVLSEEARFGIAEAQRALGRPEAEREALRAFLAAHPRSGLRARAERRLDALATAGN